MRKGARRNKKISKFYLFILVVLIAVFVVSAYIIINWVYETNKSKNVNSEIVSNVIKMPINPDGNALSSQEIEIDFDKLLEINEQVVGWIKIEDTDINYPIVKAVDNNFYLNHNILKEVSQNGWIFMDYRNNEDFLDKNTVIFGHNIKSGIMFSDLKKIYNGSLNGDIKICVYNKTGEVNKYFVYSCYMEEPESLPINPYIDNKNYSSFVSQIKSKSIYEYRTKITDNNTITLSTCDSTGQKRILVHAIKQ